MAPLTIAGARIVDVVAGVTTGPKTILVEGDRIASIVDASPSAASLFVAPGLIDAHVHLVLDGGDDPIGAYRRLSETGRLAQASASARRAIGAGITTVRDLGAPLAVIARTAADVARGGSPGPDIVFAGAAITRVGGHIGLFGGEVRDADEARALVERQVAAGASAVKLVVSGGGLTPGTRPDQTELSEDIVRAATETALALGVPVAAHCHATTAIALAVDAGVTTIEHCSFVSAGGRVAFDGDVARRMRDADVAAVPTLSGALRTAARYRQAGAHNPDERNAITRLESRRELTAELWSLGVPILAGSDAGVTDTPHDSLHDDLASFVELGLTPLEALRSATVEPARRLGLADRGTVEVGKRADLLLLDRDPLVDVAALRTPRSVIKAGRPIRAAG
jgi:imidazolonepropionase-like amidohydrolase